MNIKKMKIQLVATAASVLISGVALTSATYAWYVYNTGRHTTKVRMAAGTGINLQISNKYDDETAYKV